MKQTWGPRWPIVRKFTESEFGQGELLIICRKHTSHSFFSDYINKASRSMPSIFSSHNGETETSFVCTELHYVKKQDRLVVISHDVNPVLRKSLAFWEVSRFLLTKYEMTLLWYEEIISQVQDNDLNLR